MKNLCLISAFIMLSSIARAGCGCGPEDKWKSLVKSRSMVFTATAVSQDKSQATFQIKKTYKGKPPHRVQIFSPKEECDAGLYGIEVDQVYMFAISPESIIKDGDPVFLGLGSCDFPRSEKDYRLEAKFLKSFKFKKGQQK